MHCRPKVATRGIKNFDIAESAGRLHDCVLCCLSRAETGRGDGFSNVFANLYFLCPDFVSKLMVSIWLLERATDLEAKGTPVD